MSELRISDSVILDGYVAERIIKGNRALLITNLVCLAVGVILFAIGLTRPKPITGWTGWGTILTVIAVINLIRYAVRRLAPRTHPLIRKLASYGEPAQVAAEINAEVARPRATSLKDRDSLVVTRSWLIEPGTYGITLCRLVDIVWVYKVQTQHRVHFIPAGKSYSVEFKQRDGNGRTLVCADEAAADATVKGVLEIAPWALAGYSDKLEKLWSRDRRQFLAMIDERRRRPPDRT